MTFVALRILIGLVVIGAIVLGLRKIWRDWTGQFRMEDKARRERDLAERRRPDVIELKRDGDGVYRPDSDERR
jgi:hypothetical protein